MTRPWLVCLVLVAACGDDGGGGGGTERRLSELSTSEARDLCEQLLADLGDAQWRIERHPPRSGSRSRCRDRD
jgi:hypothetical protein